MSASERLSSWAGGLASLCALLVLVGGIGPWARWDDQAVSGLNSQTNSGDHAFAAGIIALVAAVVAMMAKRSGSRWLWTGLLFATTAGAFAIVFAMGVIAVSDVSALPGRDKARAGWGVVLTLFAAQTGFLIAGRQALDSRITTSPLHPIDPRSMTR